MIKKEEKKVCKVRREGEKEMESGKRKEGRDKKKKERKVKGTFIKFEHVRKLRENLSHTTQKENKLAIGTRWLAKGVTRRV